MKKKISLLGLILILVFSFSGCGKSDDTVEYDQEQLEQYADFIVQNFSMMGEADFQNFSDMSDLELEMTLLQAGVPVTGENFLTMMGASRCRRTRMRRVCRLKRRLYNGNNK